MKFVRVERAAERDSDNVKFGVPTLVPVEDIAKVEQAKDFSGNQIGRYASIIYLRDGDTIYVTDTLPEIASKLEN